MPKVSAQREFETRNQALAELVQEAQTGDESALEELIHQFQPLISSVSKRYYNVSREDAFQEGYAALVECIRQFDTTRGIPFTGYVNRKLRGDVRSAMRKMWRYNDAIVSPKQDREGRDDDELYDADVIRAFSTGESVTDFSKVEWYMVIDNANLSRREQLGLLSLMQGWSSTEVGKRIGVSAETVKTWRKRAIRKIRNLLLES